MATPFECSACGFAPHMPVLYIKMNELRRIEVVECDPSWSQSYTNEVTLLRPVFGTSFVASHHIGSTSVPGLPAKPTIDIAIEVIKQADIPAFYPEMEKIGYTCRGECLDAVIPGVPGRFYFVRYAGAEHLVHVNVYCAGHPDIEEKLVFRDYLKAHPRVAADYAAMKHELAEKNRYNNIGYMRGKDAFVRTTIEKAVKWRGNEI